MGKSADKLAGKKVAVIGGSTGIGLGVASLFLDNGASVVIVSSSEDRVKRAVDGLKTEHPDLSITGAAGDLTDEVSFTEVLRSLAPFDHVILTASDARLYAPLADMDMDEIRRKFEVKFWGSMVLGKVVAKYDIIRPGGSLTLTSGATALKPGPGTAAVTALNYGLLAFSRALKHELAPKRIRVNIVIPGYTQTQGRKEGKSDAEIEAGAKEKIKHLAVDFVGTPEDVAEAYLYAARANYTTGSEILIDGGECT